MNSVAEIAIEFPIKHSDQLKLAAAFKRNSRAGFDRCVAAIDCMLLWTEKPTAKDCESSKVGAAKYLCGRKKKFGFTMQAACVTVLDDL